MGCSFSCKRLSLTSSSKSKHKTIRIVHMDGYIEVLQHPVTVSEITGKSPKHFLYTHAQLLSCSSTTPLKLNAILEAGKVYFLLPDSLFQSNVSPVDLAPLIRKLGQSLRSKSKSRNQKLLSGFSGSSPGRTTPVSSPNYVHYSDRNNGVDVEIENGRLLHEMDKSSKLRTWKPILASIHERSFDRRSESDAQVNVRDR